MIATTSGCAWFRPGPVEAPPEIATWPGLDQLRGGVITRESLSRAFWPIQRFILVSRIIAQQRRFFGKFRLDLLMISAGQNAARIRGRHPGDQTTLFELVALENQLKILMAPQRTFFEGEIPAEGSPFLRRFGVEPWELSGIVTIGQQLAESEFEIEENRWNYVLSIADQDSTGGLAQVVIDKATGLPREALWRRGNRRWEVEYESWNVFAGQSERMQWLLPTQFLIKSRRPRARIFLAPNPSTQGPQYRIDTLGSSRDFALEPPAGTERGTLEDFERALE